MIIDPKDDETRRRLSSQAVVDTAPELSIRRELFRRGLRYRLHRRLLPASRREIDIVFPRQRVAVDVRGCFWHACPEHATWPANNAEWWRDKLMSNRTRDAETVKKLQELGWRVIVVWEHDEITEAADRIVDAVTSLRS